MVKTRHQLRQQPPQLTDDIINIHIADISPLLSASAGRERVYLIQPVHGAEVIAVRVVEAILVIVGIVIVVVVMVMVAVVVLLSSWVT